MLQKHRSFANLAPRAGIIVLVLSALSYRTACTARAQEVISADGRLAIINSNENTSGWVDKLHANGVRVIGRYLARGAQKSLPTKRISENTSAEGPEWQIIKNKGIALITVYQFYNSDPLKFWQGRADTRAALIKEAKGRPISRAEFAKAEAVADAKAAVYQADVVLKQPKSAPVYVGVDFNLIETGRYYKYVEYKDENGEKKTRKEPIVDSTGHHLTAEDMKQAIRDYFTTFADNAKGYPLGVYGSGHAAELLQNSPALISYVWLAGSPGFAGTQNALKSGNWHMYQNKLDRGWFEPKGQCSNKPDKRLEVDTNIQNPQKSDIGAWGAPAIEDTRIKQIYDERMMANSGQDVRASAEQTSKILNLSGCKENKPLIVDPAGETKLISKNTTVHVIDAKNFPGWLHVDADDDGIPDGYVPVKGFRPGLKPLQ